MENVSGPAYRVHTARLVIRCWDPADAPLLKEAIDANLDHLRPWMPWAHYEPEGLPQKVGRLRQFRGKFDLDEDYYYGIFNREETQVLGGTGLHTRVGEGAREIGYWIHADYVNQGLATEVSAALVRVAFEVDRVRRVEIHCDPKNLPSATVPRKLGFTHEGTLRQRVLTLSEPDGDDLPPIEEFRDSMIWTMMAEEYQPNRAAPIEAFDAAGGRIIPFPAG
jgi:RimJ/RimL family protein N-acetyltransferase